MPWISPLVEPVPRKESRHGIVIENSSLLPSRLPIVNTENGAQVLSVS